MNDGIASSTFAALFLSLSSHRSSSSAQMEDGSILGRAGSFPVLDSTALNPAAYADRLFARHRFTTAQLTFDSGTTLVESFSLRR